MLCLIDSDKDYDSAASGATYKGANNVYKKNTVIGTNTSNKPIIYFTIYNFSLFIGKE